MTSVSSTSQSITPIYQTQNTNGVSAVDRDGDGDGGSSGNVQHRHHGHNGGSKLSTDVTSALQSMGLDTTKLTQALASSDTSASSSSSGSSDTSTVKQDLHNFMHAMFDALRSQGASNANTQAGASNQEGVDPRTRFSSDLSSLISQVGSGNAPAALTDAFNKLAQDLGANTSSTASSTGATSGSQSNATVSLQNLLSKLQQGLGYGASSSTSATGATLSTSA